MNPIILIVKIIVVALFLLMFLRSNKLVWGIGLLTVTTAILLDTLLSTFSREEMLGQLGFFYYVIAGGLMAGAALWLWGVLAPKIGATGAGRQATSEITTVKRFEAVEAPAETSDDDGTAFDRKILHDQMQELLSPDDLLDVVFDLGWSENDVISFGQNNSHLINSIIDRAEKHGQSGELSLAVERILTPIPRENLPRLEKLSEESPPTILRHYILAYYDQATLIDLASKAGVDWDLIGGDNKKTKTRNLLLYLQHRGRVGELVALLKTEGAVNGEGN